MSIRHNGSKRGAALVRGAKATVKEDGKSGFRPFAVYVETGTERNWNITPLCRFASRFDALDCANAINTTLSFVALDVEYGRR